MEDNKTVGKTVLENVNIHYTEMFSAEKKVADFILNNPEKAVATNVSELANLSGVSDATVIRMCKRVGYEGYYQLKIKLSNDLGKDQLIHLKDGSQKPNTVKELIQLFASNLLKMSDTLNSDTLLACTELIKRARMVHLVAAGNTAPIANDFGFRLGRFGIPTTYSMVPEYFFNNVSLAHENDIVIGISRSGSSRQVVQAFELAKERNLKTIAIIGHEYSPISKYADFLLLVNNEIPIFKDDGPASHLSEMAVIDALLYFVVNGDTLNINPDAVELILSEYKL